MNNKMLTYGGNNADLSTTSLKRYNFFFLKLVIEITSRVTSLFSLLSQKFGNLEAIDYEGSPKCTRPDLQIAVIV